MSTQKPKPILKRGEDGLTKYQRYYQKHPDIKDKNRERERQRRKEQKKPESRAAACIEVKTTPTQQIQNHGPATPEPSSTSPNVINHSTRPKDFFALAAVFDEQMYNDAINSLTIKSTDKHTQIFHELDLLKGYRADVVQWARGWGGVTLWDVALEGSFNNAVEEGRVDRWKEQLADHAVVGRKMLGKLHQMDGKLPSEAWKIRELWRLKIELVEILVKGLTILDLKTSILPSSCTVSYTDEHQALDTGYASAKETDSDLSGGDGDVEQADESSESE